MERCSASTTSTIRELSADPLSGPGDQGAVHLQARSRLRREGRRGRHRRRVHRPADGRPPLQRGAAPGHRGQGRRARPARERHARAITFQNYFRLYDKLAGMTGTAATEADEFHKIYNLDVISSRPTGRWSATTKATWSSRRSGRSSTRWSRRSRSCTSAAARAGRHGVDREVRASQRSCCSARGVPHQVLNAKQHEREAGIIAQAGRRAR